MLESSTTAIIKDGELSALTPKTIRYSMVEFKGMLHAYQEQHDHRYKIMPIDVIKSIRTLGLNRKRRHQYTSQKRKANPLHGKGCRPENLIKVKKVLQKEDANIVISTCNIQSVRNKDLQVRDY